MKLREVEKGVLGRHRGIPQPLQAPNIDNHSVLDGLTDVECEISSINGERTLSLRSYDVRKGTALAIGMEMAVAKDQDKPGPPRV